MKSVRFRTTAGASIALWVLVAVFALVLQWLVARQLNTALDERLLSQAEDRLILLDGGAEPGSLLSVIGDEALVVIFGPAGTVIGFEGTPQPEDAADLPAGISTATMLLNEHASVEIEQLRVAVAMGAIGTVVVADEGEAQRHTISDVRKSLAVGSAMVGLLGAGIVWLVTGRALSPVTRMRDDLAQLSGIPDTAVPSVPAASGSVHVPNTGDEIESLATAMNGLLDRLAEQTEVRKRFVSDASHELKSPIANAKILIETTPPSEGDDILIAELDRMQALVDDLLFLTKHDESNMATDQLISSWKAVDLDDLIFDEAERLAIRFAGRVDASGVQPAQVSGNGAQLSRAIRNLLENAATHATTTVRVSIVLKEATIVVQVSDDGPGVSEADRTHIFERFGRASSSRDRHTGGTGLGLSIVAAIAKDHGGTITISGLDKPGATFLLELPLI